MSEPISAAYVRASTLQQIESTDDQLARISEAIVKSEAPKLAGHYADKGVSGAKPLHKRRNGAAMLHSLRPGDHVWVDKLDRLGRNLKDIITVCDVFESRRIRLHIVNMLGGTGTMDLSSPMGKFVRNILGAAAEFERELLVERCKEKAEIRRSQGRAYHGGCPPYGKKVEIRTDGHRYWVDDPVESNRLKTILALDAKKVPCSKIAAMCKRWGWKNRAGNDMTQFWIWTHVRKHRAARQTSTRWDKKDEDGAA